MRERLPGKPPVGPHSERETLETVLILPLSPSPDTDTALLKLPLLGRHLPLHTATDSSGSAAMDAPSFTWRDFRRLCIRTLGFLPRRKLCSLLEEAGIVCYLMPDFSSLLSLAAT